MDVSVKNYVEKPLLNIFWQKMKSWCGKDTDEYISATSLTLLCGGVGSCVVYHNPNTS